MTQAGFLTSLSPRHRCHHRESDRITGEIAHLSIDARGKVNDSNMPEDQWIEQKTTAKMFEGML